MLTIGDKFPSFDLKAVVSTDPRTAFTQVTDIDHDDHFVMHFP